MKELIAGAYLAVCSLAVCAYAGQSLDTGISGNSALAQLENVYDTLSSDDGENGRMPQGHGGGHINQGHGGGHGGHGGHGGGIIPPHMAGIMQANGVCRNLFLDRDQMNCMNIVRRVTFFSTDAVNVCSR
ncbi:MAG: hypothetical protein ABIG11_10235, partial [bacterium]